MTDLRYTLYLDDCMNVLSTLPAGSVDLIVTDPPYNCGKDYGDKVNDRRPEVEYLDWYAAFAAKCYRVLADGYLYVSCTCNQLWTLRPLWEAAGFSWALMCIWHGPNYAGNSNVYRAEWRLLYEPIMMFSKGSPGPMLAEVHGINSDAVMRYPRPQRDYGGDLHREHITQKPVALYWNIIARTPGTRVLDPCMGSGSVGVACARLSRFFTGIEINPASFAIAERRIKVEHAHPIDRPGIQFPLWTEWIEEQEHAPSA